MSYKKYSWITLLSSFALLLSSCGNNSLPYNGEDNDPDDIETPWVDYSTPATSIDFEDGQDNKVLNKNELINISTLSIQRKRLKPLSNGALVMLKL